MKKKPEVRYEDRVLTIPVPEKIYAENAKEVLESFREELQKYPDRRQIYFDLKDLTYISSSGLRAFLTIQRETGIKLHLINVSDPMMNIIHTTGFSELMYVSRPFREISLDSAQEIGRGRFGAVYRLDPERVIKVCFDTQGSTLAKIERDRDISRELFQRGVPTAIPYDLVITEKGYGVIYEMVKGQTLRQYIRTHPDKLSVVFPKVSHLVRKLHGTDASGLDLPDSDRILKDQIGMILPLIPDDKKAYITGFFDRIPRRQTLVHGDLNLGNVMIIDRENGTEPEVLFIDIADAMCGHPIFDFMTIYLSASLADRAFFGTKVEEMSRQIALKKERASKELFGEDPEEGRGSIVEHAVNYWKTMLTVYFDTAGEEDYDRTDACLCELGRSALIRPYDKNTEDGKAMDLLFHTYLENLELLENVFELNW